MIEAILKARRGTFTLDAELRAEGTACVVGKNGAGKTTLLRAMAGLLETDTARVVAGGADVTRLPVERRGIVLVTPSSSLLHLDVDSHLLWGAKVMRKGTSAETLAETKDALGIDFAGPVRRLSLGMRERVSLATALLASPRAILVDESFSNLHGRREFVVRYSALARRAGVDVVFTSQDEEDGRGADQLYSIEEGRTQPIRS